MFDLIREIRRKPKEWAIKCIWFACFFSYIWLLVAGFMR